MANAMTEHSGHWTSYPIYFAGIVVGALSPQEWLVYLSLLAVAIRIFNDLPLFFRTWDKFIEKVRHWRKR